MLYQANVPTLTPFSKEDKNFDQTYVWIWRLQRLAVYNKVSEQRLDEEQH